MIWLAVAVLAPAVVGGAPGAPPSAPSIRLSPEAVRMGTFYRPVRVRVEGEAPPGSAVLVVIRGPDEAQVFNRKGRVGPVWMSVDTVHISQVPSVFIRLDGNDVHSVLDGAGVADYQLDDSAVKRRMDVRSHTGLEPEAEQLELIRASYLALKRQEGTYRVYPGAVQLEDSPGSPRRYTAELEWPRRARPDDYQVEVFACRDGSVVGRASTVLPVVQVGIPARIGALAQSHPTAYGALAVLAAVMTGFAMDSLVRRRRPRGVRRGPRKPPPPAPSPAEATDAPATNEEAVVVGESETSRRG